MGAHILSGLHPAMGRSCKGVMTRLQTHTSASMGTHGRRNLCMGATLDFECGCPCAQLHILGGGRVAEQRPRAESGPPRCRGVLLCTSEAGSCLEASLAATCSRVPLHSMSQQRDGEDHRMLTPHRPRIGVARARMCALAARRGQFNCGSTSSRAALRAAPDGLIEHRTAEFLNAIKQACAVYDLTTTDDMPILAPWARSRSPHRRMREPCMRAVVCA